MRKAGIRTWESEWLAHDSYPECYLLDSYLAVDICIVITGEGKKQHWRRGADLSSVQYQIVQYHWFLVDSIFSRKTETSAGISNHSWKWKTSIWCWKFRNRSSMRIHLQAQHSDGHSVLSQPSSDTSMFARWMHRSDDLCSPFLLIRLFWRRRRLRRPHRPSAGDNSWTRVLHWAGWTASWCCWWARWSFVRCCTPGSGPDCRRCWSTGCECQMCTAAPAPAGTGEEGCLNEGQGLLVAHSYRPLSTPSDNEFTADVSSSDWRRHWLVILCDAFGIRSILCKLGKLILVCDYFR